MSAPSASRPCSLRLILVATFLASMSGGALSSAIYFVTETSYGYSARTNLLLALIMGGIYAAIASRTGPILRALERRVTPRTALQAALAGWGATSLLPFAVPGSEVALWTAAIGGAATSAITWPIVQSFLSAGRSGRVLRSSIGWFNVTWTPATALPQLLMPLLAVYDLRATFALGAVTAVGAAVVVYRFPVAPPHDLGDDGAHQIGREYVALARSSGWLLPLSYLLSFTLTPILPFRLGTVGIDDAWKGAVGAVWMVLRFFVLVVMWRVGFWHGRWGALVAAATLLVGGVTLVLAGTSSPVVIAGLIVFGAGMALTYYQSLYYRLAVGRGAVDAGGGFETLVGLGSFAGPVVGLSARLLGGPAHGNDVTLALVGVAALGAVALALRPYRALRTNPDRTITT